MHDSYQHNDNSHEEIINFDQNSSEKFHLTDGGRRRTVSEGRRPTVWGLNSVGKHVILQKSVSTFTGCSPTLRSRHPYIRSFVHTLTLTITCVYKCVLLCQGVRSLTREWCQVNRVENIIPAEREDFNREWSRAFRDYRDRLTKLVMDDLFLSRSVHHPLAHVCPEKPKFDLLARTFR